MRWRLRQLWGSASPLRIGNLHLRRAWRIVRAHQADQIEPVLRLMLRAEARSGKRFVKNQS